MARYYSSGTNRFFSVDPVADAVDSLQAQTWNKYTYVSNNPVTAVDPDGKVQFGPHNESKSAYAAATAELSKSTEAVALLKSFESLGGELEPTIRLTDALVDGYDSETNTIYWNPELSGDLSGEGGHPNSLGSWIMSPAQGLAHEIDHAVQANLHPNQFEKAADTPDKQYTNKEEKRVVRGSETKIAKQIDGPTRKTHGGQPVVKGKRKHVANNDPNCHECRPNNLSGQATVDSQGHITRN